MLHHILRFALSPIVWTIGGILPTVAWGFVGPTRTGTSLDTKTRNLVVSSMVDQHQTQSSTDSLVRNIFHDYDKPLVLLGCSSEQGKELPRLADFLLEQHMVSGNRVSIVSETGSLRTVNTIIRDHSWPDVVVIDFGEEELFRDDRVTEKWTALAESLYQDGFLSVFINVDLSTSMMSDATRTRKDQLESTLFVPFSDYELCIKGEGTDEINWEHIQWELTRLLARARLVPAIPGDKTRSENCAHLLMGQHTFFLSLSFPEISQVEPYVQEMCRDVDAMEYRTDLLQCRDNRFDILYGMQQLRKYCRPHAVRVPALPFGRIMIEDNVPVVYTVRTCHQAGTFPDDENSIKRMFEMLVWGLRGGVEVLDVESDWDPTLTASLLDKAEMRYASQLLGSHHVVGKEVTLEDAVLLFQQCALNGRAHGAKLVLSISEEEKDRMAYEAGLIATALAQTDGKPIIPHISLVLGDVGQFSRVINLPFTPVTHESLPVKAAPGQMTSNEIMATRLLTRIFETKKYAILGHNIAYSVSPQMQGAAFAATRLPHQYLRADVDNVQEFVQSQFFKSPDFGGCSVTIPHKQTIVKYVDVLSDEAKTIGSVNTLIVKEEFVDDDMKRVVYGDNTDWRGVYNPLKRIFGGTVVSGKNYALILGAGGTARAAAFAAIKLGLGLLFYNRTPSKAQELVKDFGGTVVTSLERESLPFAQADSSIRVIISTLPAASNFVLPEWLLQEPQLPVIFDVNYKPYSTNLLRQGDDAGCILVRGSEMLWEQGVGQFELWTERSAPYRVMKEIVLRNCVEITT